MTDSTVDELSKSLKKRVTFDESSMGEQKNDIQSTGTSSNNFTDRTNKQPDDTLGWPIQDYNTIDPHTITPLDPVIMHRQATLNIGTIGHVAHGML